MFDQEEHQVRPVVVSPACVIRCRFWTSRFGRGNLIGRAFDYLTFYVFATAKLWALARSGDVIVAKTDPPLISVAAGGVAKDQTDLRGGVATFSNLTGAAFTLKIQKWFTTDYAGANIWPAAPDPKLPKGGNDAWFNPLSSNGTFKGQ